MKDIERGGQRKRQRNRETETGSDRETEREGEKDFILGIPSHTLNYSI